MGATMLKEYKAWDAPTRIFHWVNFTTVILLICMGLIMLFKKELGIASLDAKIMLKTVHVLIGYVFVLNLVVRIAWAFAGNRLARWSSMLPGKGFVEELRGYLASIRSGEPKQYLGHNPLGRLAVSAMMAALLVLAITGLVRAGTDIYYPPFGAIAAEFVAAEGVEPASLKPYDKTFVDAAKMKQLEAFKGPFGEVHIYTAYFLMLLIVLHIAAVVRAEIRDGDRLVSGMISGRKVLSREPEDP